MASYNHQHHHRRCHHHRAHDGDVLQALEHERCDQRLVPVRYLFYSRLSCLMALQHLKELLKEWPTFPNPRILGARRGGFLCNAWPRCQNQSAKARSQNWSGDEPNMGPNIAQQSIKIRLARPNAAKQLRGKHLRSSCTHLGPFGGPIWPHNSLPKRFQATTLRVRCEVQPLRRLATACLNNKGPAAWGRSP